MPSSTPQLKVKLFTGGCCTHAESMVLRGASSRTVAFPSLFALIEHPTCGRLLYDTGYAPHFFEATEAFPERFYRMLTPVTLDTRQTAVAQLAQAGLSPEDIDYVLISHFHGDHVAGLRDFPSSRLVFLAQGYDFVKALRGTRAVRIGYLPALLPADFASRALPIGPDSDLRVTPPRPFGEAFDLFGDGSLLLIPFEGHFCGQMGALIQTATGPVLLAADACWKRDAFEQGILPHPLAMRLFYDRQQYAADLGTLAEYQRLHPAAHVIPSHCERSIAAFQAQEAA